MGNTFTHVTYSLENQNDSSPGCWMTNILCALVSIYAFPKFLNLVQKYYQEIQKIDYADDTSKTYVYKKFLIYLVNCIFNGILVISHITAGLSHSVYYEYNVGLNRPMWRLTLFLTGLQLPFLCLFTFYYSIQVNTWKAVTSYIYWMLGFGLILGIEELFFSLIGVGILFLLVVVGQVCFSIHPIYQQLTNTNNKLKFRAKLTAFGVIFQLGSTLYYTLVANKCNKPFASANHGCPFPDAFNHNAFIHVVFTISVYMFYLAITETENWEPESLVNTGNTEVKEKFIADDDRETGEQRSDQY